MTNQKRSQPTKFSLSTAVKSLGLERDKLQPTTFLSGFLANSLIALSGFVLYSDKALTWLNISFGIQKKWADVGMDFPTYIWLLSQTVSPVLIIIGAALKPRTIMYAVPLYCYMLQLYWVFLDHKIVDDSYLQAYVIGSTILLLAGIFIIRWLLHRDFKNKLKAAKSKLTNNE